MKNNPFPDTYWTPTYPMCGGTAQSPINIDPSTMPANYSDFTFSLGYRISMTGSISNTGYASNGQRQLLLC